MNGQLGYVVPLHPCGDSIRNLERNDFSQFGEDGLIEAALKRIGEKNRWCFECGAADGEFYSNTKTLRDKGWHSVLIEGSHAAFQKLKELENDRTRCVHEQIGPLSLDRILQEHGCPVDCDLGVIDIDGQDFWCWAGMQDVRPRLMLVEFAPREDNNSAWEIPQIDWTGQATLVPIVNLGQAKGYEPILRTHCNVLFAKRELLWAKQ